MTQTEIQFFWPLTEQIPLDLDYTDCDKEPVYSYINSTEGGFIYSNLTTTNTLHINLDNVKPFITQNDMPWYRKLAFKALGFKINENL